MSPAPDMGAIALRELAAIASIVDGIEPSDFTRPTQLPGWTVEDLVRHVAGVATRQGEAFHRARLAIQDAPSDATVTVPLDRLAQVMRVATSQLTNAVHDLDVTGDPIVPLPYATLPATIAMYVLLVEYGVHRYDLEAALVSGHLAADVAHVIADLLGVTLPALAARDVTPTCEWIRFEPRGRPATTLAWQDGVWAPIDEAISGSCVVRGSADAVALFVLGRITEGDDRLAVEGPNDALRGFKTMFPGP